MKCKDKDFWAATMTETKEARIKRLTGNRSDQPLSGVYRGLFFFNGWGFPRFYMNCNSFGEIMVFALYRDLHLGVEFLELRSDLLVGIPCYGASVYGQVGVRSR